MIGLCYVKTCHFFAEIREEDGVIQSETVSTGRKPVAVHQHTWRGKFPSRESLAIDLMKIPVNSFLFSSSLLCLFAYPRLFFSTTN